MNQSQVTDDVLRPERRRLELHAMFKEILGNDNVYYQPPETVKLKYPCIIYSKTNNYVEYANGAPYMLDRKYTVTVITKEPDSVIPDMLALKPHCSFNRSFSADGLTHNIFSIY